MGYTHYWRKPEQPFTDNQWNKLKEIAHIVNDICRNELGIPLWFEYDDPRRMSVTNQLIRFNGAGDDGHETFYFERKFPSGFNFTKTALKPYDAAVVAMLCAASECNPYFEWTSDGSTLEHRKGIELFFKAYDRFTHRENA